MTGSIRQVRFDERIATLLKESDLPAGDLPGRTEVMLFSCTAGNELRGVVGIELYGPCGLLRSLAVAPGHRGEGIGAALLACAEHAARASGVTELFLLTTTAERYFSGRGYAIEDRAAAPAAISGTQQFSHLCPSSSAFMVKKIADVTG